METFRFLAWFSVLCIAAALSAVMAVFITINPATAATDPATAPKVYDVQDDPGGNVGEYYQGYQKLSKEGATIRFHGVCASACTMVLFREFTGIKACADEDAIFAFHKPFQKDDSGKAIQTDDVIQAAREVWTLWLVSFPYDVFNVLKDAPIPSPSEGDSMSDMFVVPAIFFVPQCEVAAQ